MTKHAKPSITLLWSFVCYFGIPALIILALMIYPPTSGFGVFAGVLWASTVWLTFIAVIIKG